MLYIDNAHDENISAKHCCSCWMFVYVVKLDSLLRQF